MEIKQGNTYMLNAQIKDIDMSEVAKIVVKFEEIEKTYEPGVEGDITIEEDGIITIYLSQEDTLQLEDDVRYEIAVKFNDGQVEKSNIKKIGALSTLIKKVI